MNATSNLCRHPPPIFAERDWYRWWMLLAVGLGIGGLVVAIVAVVQYLRGA